MDRSQVSLSEEQQRALQETLERANAFEEMVRSQGWEHVKAYYQSRVQAFATKILTTSGVAIESFESERQQLIGLKNLLGHIDSALTTLQEERRKANEVHQEK